MSPSAKRMTELTADVREAAERIWFAGLGAMAFAQEEGGRLVGGTTDLFATLVEKGQEMERERQAPVEAAKAAAVSPEGVWTKVQTMLDAQVTAALQRLGVPTRDELAELNRKIEQLTASIEALRVQG